MSEGLEKLLARRIWFVPDVMIWGTSGLGELDYLIYEKVGSDGTVFFGQSSFFDGRQHVMFGDLTDHRGNRLPSTLQSPRVLIRSRDRQPVYVVGQESNSGVTLARDQAGTEPVMADLLVVEMGD
ncbi:MAG: hypothetical protein WAU88_07730 [Candidatus Zixiibacteriota bacterium]